MPGMKEARATPASARRLLDTMERLEAGRGRKPEALEHDVAGYWSRRITDEHRLVHKIGGDEVRIAACRYHYA